MAQIKLPPDQRAKLEQAERDLLELDASMEALDSIGALHPGLKEAHEANKKSVRVLLEKF